MSRNASNKGPVPGFGNKVPHQRGNDLFVILYTVALLVPYLTWHGMDDWTEVFMSILISPILYVMVPFGMVQILGITNVGLGIVVFACTAVAYLFLLLYGIKRRSWFLFILFVALQILLWYGMHMQAHVLSLED